MSPHTRRKAQGPKEINSPSVRLRKDQSPSPPPDNLKKQKIKSISQEVTETQKESKSGDSCTESSSKYGFVAPGTKGTSQEVEKCLSTKRTGSPTFEVKKPKVTVPSEKAGKYRYSSQTCSSLFKVKKEENKASSERTQDCHDLELYHFTDRKLEECGSTERIDPISVEHEKPEVSLQKAENCDVVNREDSRLREFKRLQQRCLELDKEREALTLAIGNEMGLTANMQLLHEYNTIKDITQIVIGSLSNILNIPVTQLHQELNLSFEK